MIKNFELYLGEKPVVSGDSCADPLIFSWHMENVDVTLGTPGGCSQHATKTVDLYGNMALSTTRIYDGTYSLMRYDANDYATFSVSGGSTTGMYVSWWMNIDNYPSTGDTVLWIIGDYTNGMRVYITSASTIVCQVWYGGSNKSATLSGCTVDTDYICYAYWRSGGSPYIYINCGGNIAQQANSISAWGAAPTSAVLGEDDTSNTRFYIDNLKIYNVYNPSV